MSAGLKWTLAIVGLLVGNMIAMVILITCATAGRSHVIPDYYERAAHYDDSLDEASRSAALGWTATATLSGSSLRVDVRDATGRELIAAKVHVTGYPRASPDRTFTRELIALAPGAYAAPRPTANGVYDLRIVVDRDNARFVTERTVVAETTASSQGLP